MKVGTKTLGFLWLFLSGSVAYAGPSTYMCEVLQIVELSSDGRLREHKGIWKNHIGEKFTVNRNSGEMIGLPFSTGGWLGGVQVLNPGSDENSYIALVLSGKPNIAAKYLHIAEHVTSVNKPFWGNGDSDVIFTGTCF